MSYMGFVFQDVEKYSTTLLSGLAFETLQKRPHFLLKVSGQKLREN